MRIYRARFIVVSMFIVLTNLGIAQRDLQELARSTTGPNDADNIAALRAAGARGLAAMLDAHPARPTTETFSLTPIPRQRDGIDDAIDAIAAQRDARASGLFWYTELEAAKAEAAKTNRPILSLRLLGKLSEVLSCANSRFFRTVLYPNREISSYIRQNYVLHWETVRDVPVIEIDFGKGRKLRRTITGNSIHYVLDSRGRLVDALPGLYGPGRFLKMLQKAAGITGRLNGEEDNKFQAALKEYHEEQLAATSQERARLSAAPSPAPDETQSKLMGLRPVASSTPTHRADLPDDPDIIKLAAALAEESHLDAASRDLINAKTPRLAMALAVSKSITESPLLRMVRNLEYTISLDTAKNEFELRPQLRRWLADAEHPVKLFEFNRKVYAELFLMHPADPWLGMVPPDVYAALDDEGLSTQPDPMHTPLSRTEIGNPVGGN